MKAGMAYTLDKIPEWVSKYIGIPFKDLGRTKTGCDCWGLVRLILAEKMNIFLPSFAEDYLAEHNTTKVKQLIEEQKNYRWIKTEDPEAFDVAEMILPVNVDGKYSFVPVHVGILVNKHFLLHTNRIVGSHIVSTNKNKQVVGYWRYNASSKCM